MRILAAIYRFFLSLRYKVEIKGEYLLKDKRAKLILPNHQALVDPQLIFTYFYQYITVVPVVTENFYTNPLLRKIFEAMDAVPVSDLSSGSRDLNVLKSLYESVDNALRNGKNVLLYPSGQIAGQGYEKIYNKQGAWTVVRNLPENVQIIGVRIHGLWGSMWSKAWIARSPDFFSTYLKGVFYLLANLFFFAPKRKVTIELTDLTHDCKEKAKETRTNFNKYLEEFYNLHGEEHATYIKHYFFVSGSKRKLIEENRRDFIVGERENNRI